MNDTRKRRPTLQDIADLTGVTKMTVSRYLRDPSAVAEGTRERIAAAVEELGYIPNRAPDMLSNATSKAIGILIPSLSNQVFSAVIHGIEAVTRPAGYQTLLAHYGYSPEREEEQVASLLSYNVDGLILSDTQHTERTRKMIATAGIPVVVVQHLFPEGFPVFARGSQGADLHPEVARRHRDHLVEKGMASALTATDLGPWLRERGIDTLSVVGYMTHNCDDATARQAMHEGWKVELLHDAAGSLPYTNAMGTATAEEIHRVFTVVMHTGFAAVVSTDEWLQALAAGEPLAADNVFLSNQRALAGRGTQ